MASIQLDAIDAPVCPFLGLADDPRSHFTYPHPAHRCFATGRAATTDARRQASFCLAPRYPVCDRYEKAKRSVRAAESVEHHRAPGEGGSAPAGPRARQEVGPGTVVLVFRAGDSLARIASRYGLRAEQIAMANGLALTDAITEGTRLVIPLGQSAPNLAGPEPKPTTGS